MDISADRLRSENNFQQVLIQLAMRFINCPVDRMDETLAAALREVVEALGAFRASINMIHPSRSHYTNMYEWQSPRQTPPKRLNVPFPDKTDIFPILENGGALVVNNRDDLPDDSELKQLFILEGIMASAGIPVLHSGSLIAIITVSWEHPYDVSPEIVNLLRVVGEIFLNLLERKENEDRLEQRVQERTEELRQSENQLRAIIESMPLPMIVADEKGNLLYLNSMATAVFGIDLQSVHASGDKGYHIDLMSRETLSRKIREQGYVRDYEIHYRAMDGTMRSGLISIHPVQFMGKMAYLSSFVDVTEIKQMQQIEREQRTLSEALLDSALVLMGTLELNEVINHILTNLRRVVPHDTCNVMIIEGEDGVVLGHRNYIEDGVNYAPIRLRIPIKDGYFAGLMIDSKMPVIVGDTTRESRLIAITDPPSPIKAYLGVPVIIRQEVFGFINLGSREKYFFTEAHVKYLQLFALQAGLAIQNARHFIQARAIATLEERQRLARDLHDSVTQTIFSANSIAEMLPLILERKPEKIYEYLDEMMTLTRGAMAEMRTLLVELRPEALTQTEFSILIGHLCDVFTGKTQVDVVRRINKKALLSPEIQIAFYRVAQEALNNIAKYARAQNVELSVNHHPDSLEMRIRDDGVGFDMKRVSAEHFGLKIMRERAREIGAELLIESAPGEGTEIRLRKPL